MLGQAGAWQPAIRREPRCRSTVGVRVDLTWLRPGPTSRAVVTPARPRSYRDEPPAPGRADPYAPGGLRRPRRTHLPVGRVALTWPPVSWASRGAGSSGST